MRNLSYGLIAAALAVAVMATPAAAIDANVVSQASHFAECAKWLISDPAKHAQFCSPGHEVFISTKALTGPMPADPCREGRRDRRS